MNVDKIEQLTDAQRECLRAYFILRSYKAVAVQLNISIESVKDRLERARRRLDAMDSDSAAYALAVAEGVISPPARGWPPTKGLTITSPVPAGTALPMPGRPVVTAVRDNSATTPIPPIGATPLGEKSDDTDLSKRLSVVSGRVLQSAQIIALIVMLAAITMAAINSLQPGFFRILDNLHS